MKRLLLIGLLALAAATTAAPASAGTLCRNRILDQWEATGKIATTFPVSCYRQALAYANANADVGVYSSLPTDIREAMAAAIARRSGKKVAPTVGKAFKRNNGPQLTSNRPSSSTSSPVRPTTIATGPVSSTSSGSSIPVPLLVLGGIALLLAAAGAAGTIARRRRS